MKSTLRAVALLSALALAACAAPRVSGPPATKSSLSASQLLAVVQHDADRLDQSKDPAERSRLMAEVTLSAQQCLTQFPNAGACEYAQAQVEGLTARERPVQAPAILKDMLASLTRAEALDAKLDHAGPARLTAIVLMRAPPWPLGPGDTEAAVTAAQRAVKLDPAYPPNLITLGQTQAKADGAVVARATLAKAVLAVQASAASPAERAQWQQEIDQDLRQLR